ncbi:MAG TPA: transglycosylase domain-containing protein [Vicinamibacterales bacterium]|nr:transglycosylase domain-containing protein [Vicinamibacterales bacterium]
MWTLLIALGAATGVAMHRLWELRNGLERLADDLSLDAGPESTLLYDANDALVSAVVEEHRIAVALEEVSPHLVNAVLVTEDKRFYSHNGVDLPRIVKAFVANQRAGEIVQGASTITQQLVRSILLSRERSYTRKAKEVVLARRLEEMHSKRAILEAYLNRVYFGDGYYGIEAAALGYFGKTAAELDVVESALLAGLIKGPAYTVFANRGLWRTPTLIRRVVDGNGRELYRAPETERAVISDATAYLMTSMMADVVNRGTASTARAAGFRHAAAGKTGTSQSYADAWFVGYTPALVTGVWIGFDTPRRIMDRGFASVVAVPAWARFMSAALVDNKTRWFEMPASLVKVTLCRLSGQLATERCHLPVIEPPSYDPDHPFALTTAMVHHGGVYEELRRIYREPAPCSLLHGEGVADHVHTGSAGPLLGRTPPTPPPSMRPALHC